MAIKLLLNAVAVAAVFIVGLTSVESVELCDAIKLGGVQCTTCNFLTFGQENVGFGLSFFCPNDDSDRKYCCYGPSRKPFCCNATGYILGGFIWLVAVIAIITGICKLIKFLIF